MIYVLIAVFSFWFAGLTGIPRQVAEWLCRKGIRYKTYEDGVFRQRYARRLKPFDCELCLAFWIGLGYELVNKVHPLEAILWGGITSFLALVTMGLYNRHIR